MPKENEIRVGDIVSVDFNNSKYTLLSYAEVLHVPCATGDSWHFKEPATGNIHYVSEGCTVTKRHNKSLQPAEDGG